MENNENELFVISVESYKNKGLDLLLGLRIESKDKLDQLLNLECAIELEDGFCIKDAYTTYLGTEVRHNTLLPPEEVNFFEAHKHYKIDGYSDTAKQLAQQVEKYLGDLLFGGITFQIAIKPEFLRSE